MCVSSFKKGFTSLSLKTRLLGEKQHRSTLPAAACYNNSTTTRRTSSSGGGGGGGGGGRLDWRHQLQLWALANLRGAAKLPLFTRPWISRWRSLWLPGGCFVSYIFQWPFPRLKLDRQPGSKAHSCALPMVRRERS